MQVRRTAVALVALGVALSGCAKRGTPAASHESPSASPPTVSFPVTLSDDDGVVLTMKAAPQRIVTWGPSNTEILFALGLGDRVIGVSGSFDDYPPQAKDIVHVGDASGVQPNAEKVVSLHPDLVLNAFLGGDQWKARLRGLGIPVFSIYAANLDDALHDIRTVGELTGATAAATKVTDEMSAQARSISSKVAASPAVSCFLEEGYPGIYTVGPHTFVFDILERAGCAPVTADANSDYPTWSLEKLVQEDPAVYLVASESGVSASDVGKRPGFGSLAAVRNDRVYEISSDLISRPSPRLIEGLMGLVKLLHPEVFPS